MHSSLSHTAHRPWPVPAGRWSWRQSWCDLLFAHWPVPVSRLRALVPDGLEVQEFDGTAWVGVVPFRMVDVAPRSLPTVPGLSTFAEINVRTYVTCEGKPGVWFLSLDAASRVAVLAGRTLYSLPYFPARIRVSGLPDRAVYRSVRSSARAETFRAEYAPTTAPYEAVAGTLEHWLTERYCLYAGTSAGRLYRTEVHHRPWPLQSVQLAFERNDLLAPVGVSPKEAPTLTHFSRGVDVVSWRPVEVSR